MTKSNPTKSDYFDNQRKTCTNRKSKQQLGLKELLNDNPFNIPEQMLSDWIENRKKKRAPITITAWNKILKELIHCKAQHTDPIEAFETMVASGWNSLKAKYFESPKQNSTSQWDVDSVMRA
ncbi:TPA: hypothetical protein ACP9C9_002007 [Legionella anisa]